MNLALKDARYHIFKFISSTIGVSLLLMVVFVLGGIIRGVILDSSTVVVATNAHGIDNIATRGMLFGTDYEIGNNYRAPRLRRERVGLGARGIAVDQHAPPLGGERAHQHRADALGAAGDDGERRGTEFGRCGHAPA